MFYTISLLLYLHCSTPLPPLSIIEFEPHYQYEGMLAWLGGENICIYVCGPLLSANIGGPLTGRALYIDPRIELTNIQPTAAHKLYRLNTNVPNMLTANLTNCSGWQIAKGAADKLINWLQLTHTKLLYA
jgi:hypothetical protein